MQDFSEKDFSKKDENPQVITDKLNQLHGEPEKNDVHLSRIQYFSHFNQTLPKQQLNNTSNPSNLMQDPKFINKIKKFLTNQNFDQLELKISRIQLSTQINTKILTKLKNYHVTQIFLQYGPFSKKYTVLNQLKQSHRHENALMGFGSFGNVYHCQTLDPADRIVVKCLKYHDDDLCTLKDHFREFFLCDLMSALEVGPKIIKNHSFDFIIFKDCIQFIMERCEPVKTETLERDAKMSLFKMHTLNIVHSDIKPSNIMYSPSLNKNVLIDFGIACFIKQSIGQKTLTVFKGTYEFCGEEMRQVFSKKCLHVDLYLNDAQMLEKSIHYLEDRHKKRQSDTYKKITLNSGRKEPFILEDEISLIFQFHLYRNKNETFIVDESISFFKQFQNQGDQKLKSQIVEKGLGFVELWQDPQDKVLIHHTILNQLVSNHSRRELFQDETDMILEQVNNRATEQDYDKKLTQKYQKIYNFLETCTYDQQVDPLSSQDLKGSNNFGFTELTHENIEFIVFQQKELFRFSEQQVYFIFLNYVSFWQSKLKVDIQKKQNAAKVVRKIIQSRVNLTKIPFLNEKYTPQLQFVKEKCQNLVFVYGYLLSYCMEGQLNKFKQLYMMLILKDCIILNFRYLSWITEYMTVYFKGLIRMAHTKLITRIYIDYNETLFLSKKSFYFSNSSELIDTKVSTIRQRQIIQKCIDQIEQSYEINEPYYINKLILEHLHQGSSTGDLSQIRQVKITYQQAVMFLNQPNNEYIFAEKGQSFQKMKQITQKINLGSVDKTFINACIKAQCFSEIFLQINPEYKLATFYNSQLFTIPNFLDRESLRYYYNKRQKVSKQIKQIIGFDIRFLFQNTNQSRYNKSDIFKQIELFDYKIHCPQLSIRFHLVQRFQLYCLSGQVQKVIQILNFVSESECFLQNNFDILYQFIPPPNFMFLILSLYQQNSSLCVDYMNATQKFYHLFHRHLFYVCDQQIQLYMAIRGLFNIFKQNLLTVGNNIFLKENIRFYQQFNQKVCFLSSKLYLLQILQFSYPSYSLQYLLNQKQLLNCVEKYLLKDPKNSSPSPLTITYNFLDQEIIILLLLPTFTDQIDKYWRNLKIESLLNKSFILNFHHQQYLNLAMEKKIQTLVELFFVTFLQKKPQDFVTHFQQYQLTFRKIARLKTIRNQFYQVFLFCLNQLKKFRSFPLHLLAIYFFVMEFHDQLNESQKIYKKLMLEMYLTFNQSCLNTKINRSVLLEFRHFIWIMSVRYLKVRSYPEIKIKKVIKFHCNNHNENQDENKNISQFYLSRLKSDIVRGFGITDQKEGRFAKSQIKNQQLVKGKFLKLQLNMEIKKLQNKKKYIQLQKQIYFRQFQQFAKSQTESFQRFYHSQNQFKQKYRIRNVTIFRNQRILNNILKQLNTDGFQSCIAHESIIMQYQQLIDDRFYPDENMVSEKLHILNEKVMRIKKTRQFFLAEQSIQLIDRILQLRRKMLEQQLRSTGHGKLIDSNIKIQMIFQSLTYNSLKWQSI